MDPIGTYSQSAEYNHGQHHLLEVPATVAYDGDIWMSNDPTGSGK